MTAFLMRRWKIKRLKLQVWNRRLQAHMRYFAPRISPLIACSVNVYWGPFYGGSLVVDRRFRSARIDIQIPYDGYLTAAEQRILSQFSLKKSLLPSFIFYHEIAHLLELLPYIGESDLAGLRRYVAGHKRLASASSAAYKD